MAKTLKEVLKDYTKEGELYERREGDRVLCYACGHRCVILPGLDGICRVRYNEGGTLMVPAGYVGAIQCDPTEKKPFFHAYPGSLALTFGMLGCDLHCSYCFTGETTVITEFGPTPLSEIFGRAESFKKMPDGEIGFVSGLKVVSASGKLRQVRAAFKHPYRGKLISIAPYYLPILECTPDHRIYATDDISRPPEPIEARLLTSKHYLAVPRRFEFSDAAELNTFDLLGSQLISYRAPWKLSPKDRQFIIEATARGETSRHKSSAARLFKSLCGGRANEKQVPRVVFEASEAVARAFLEAYVEGDGHRYANGKVSVTTVSRKLAYGIAWLALKLGYIPSVYETAIEEEGVIQGRKVKRSPFQFTVVWYESSSITRKVIEAEEHYLVPIKSIASREFDGPVYNLEVEEEHNYLANFALVSNCQNWVTSQALRDPKAVAPPRAVTPEQMVETARR
jgi:LAGLIDADG-like domain